MYKCEKELSILFNYSIIGLSAASWYKADVMEVYQEAVASGAEFNTSDALTINGQPGALFDCSTGIFRK